MKRLDNAAPIGTRYTANQIFQSFNHVIIQLHDQAISFFLPLKKSYQLNH